VLVVKAAAGNLLHLDSSQGTTLRPEKSDNVQGHGASHGDVNAVVNGAENDGEDTSEEDDKLQRADTPELVDSVGRGDQISDGVDDDSAQRCAWNVKEDGSQGVDSDEHDDSSNDASQRSSDTSLRLDGGSAEGAGRRVSTDEWTQQVGNTDGDQLLRGVDAVVVDTAERLRDGDVFNQENNNTNGDLAGEETDDVVVDLWHSSILEYVERDQELRIWPS